MAAMRLSGWRVCALVSAMLLGIIWAWGACRLILALNGDCEGVRDAKRFSAYTQLVTPVDGVELVGTDGKEQSRPDGTPWFRVARSVASCFPDRVEGNQLKLPPDQWPEDFIESVTWRAYGFLSAIPGRRPDATWPYPFNSEAGECVYAEVLRLQSLANASFPDSYCGISWWGPLLGACLIEGVLPALGLFAAVWFLVARRTQLKRGA